MWSCPHAVSSSTGRRWPTLAEVPASWDNASVKRRLLPPVLLVTRATGDYENTLASPVVGASCVLRTCRMHQPKATALAVMGDVTPREFVCDWNSSVSHLQDDDKLTGEDAALARWRGADRVATRKLRIEASDCRESTLYTIDAVRPASASRRRQPLAMAAFSKEDTGTAIRIERADGLVKRQRPQSACSAAAHQRQLERSRAPIEPEARAIQARHGRDRQRPQSVKSHYSALFGTRDTRDELADTLVASKWTEMLHRSPSFRQSRLQKLEAETYALLQFALGKTRTRNAMEAANGTSHSHLRRISQQSGPLGSARQASASTRPYSAKQGNQLGSSDGSGSIPTSELACGSGVQVARSKKHQRLQQVVAEPREELTRQKHHPIPSSKQPGELREGRDLGSLNGSSMSDEERRAIREKTRLRGNEKKHRAIATRSSGASKASRGDSEVPTLGWRTATRSHWTERSSLALPATAHRIGDDRHRSPRMEEYLLAVSEPVSPQRFAEQQLRKVKRNSATPREPKSASQSENTPVSASRESEQAYKSEHSNTGSAGDVCRKKVQHAEPCIEPIRCDSNLQSHQVAQMVDALVPDKKGCNRESVMVAETELRKDPSASAPESAEPNWGLGDISSALSTIQLAEKTVSSPLITENRSKKGELVGGKRAAIDGNGRVEISARPPVVVGGVLASATCSNDSEQSDCFSSGSVDGRNAAITPADCEFDTAVAVCPDSSGVILRLVDAEQIGESNTTIPLQLADDRVDDLDTETEILGGQELADLTAASSSPDHDVDCLQKVNTENCTDTRQSESEGRPEHGDKYHEIDALVHVRSGDEVAKTSDARDSTSAQPNSAKDLQSTQSSPSEEASDIVPMLVVTIAEVSNVVTLNDSVDPAVNSCTTEGSRYSELFEYDGEPLEIPLDISSHCENAAGSPITEVPCDYSCGYISAPDSRVSTDWVSPRPHDEDCVQPGGIGSIVDGLGEFPPMLPTELSECEARSFEGMNGKETTQLITSKVDALLPIDEMMATSTRPLAAEPSLDNEHMALTNNPVSSAEIYEAYNDVTRSHLTNDSEAVIKQPSEVIGQEQELGDGMRDTVGVLLPDRAVPNTEFTQEYAFTRDSAPCEDELLDSIMDVQELDVCNEIALASPAFAAAVPNPSGVEEDAKSSILTKEDVDFTPAVGCVAPSDNAIRVSVNTPERDNCGIGAPDQMRDDSRENASQRTPSNEIGSYPQTSDQFPLPETSSDAAQGSVEAVEPIPLFVDVQGSPLCMTVSNQQLPDVDTSAPQELPIPDEVSTLLRDSACRIQRQYRCFTGRRLLVDQLQFYLRYQRRQARKRAKRKSQSSSVAVVDSVDSSAAQVVKEELPAHQEDCAPAAPTATETETPSENMAASENIAPPTSATGNIVGLPTDLEEHQTQRGDEGDGTLHQAELEPQLIGCLSKGFEAFGNAVAESQPSRHDGEWSPGHNDIALVSAGADEEVYRSNPDSAAAEGRDNSTRYDGEAAPPDEPLDFLGLAFGGEINDLQAIYPADVSQEPEVESNYAITHMNIDADAGESALQYGLSRPQCSESDVEFERTDSEHVAPIHNTADGEPQDDHAIDAEQLERYMDAASKKSFYYNRTTGESRWTATPDDEFSVSSTALDGELVSTPSLVPDELGRYDEWGSSSTDDADELADTAIWEPQRQSSQLGEQRGGWQALVDEATQATFYCHTVTGESTWVPPREFQDESSLDPSDVMDPGAAGSLPPLDDEWVTCIDPASGMPYYANLATNETRWEDPRGVSEGSRYARASAPSALDLCELALEGDADGDDITQMSRSGGVAATVNYSHSLDGETPYEEDYVIDVDDKARH